MQLDTDLFVVIGFLLAVLSFPSAMGTYAEGYFPKIALMLMALGVFIALTAALLSPDGYTIGRIPHSFIEILARIFN